MSPAIMSRFANVDLNDAVDHPVLAEPWTYFVKGLAAEFDPDTQLHNSLDLTLVRDGEIVRLRFRDIEQLEIEAGFPYLNSGLKILDVSHLGWESIKIRVTSFEPEPGMYFWAKLVDRLS